MMNALVWVVLLFVLGLGVMVLEVFLPSGGILGFLSITALIAAISTAFLEMGTAAGMAALAVATVVVPVVLSLAFRWFPETPLGRRVLPPPPDAADTLPDPDGRRRLQEMVGRVGRATTEMLPWGVVEIDGTPFDAMSESGPVDSGAIVEAVRVEGRALVVVAAHRPRIAEHDLTAGPTLAGRPAQAEDEAAEAAARLSPTLESFEFDRFEPPRT
jgi:membrane-bound ClpP family serine protease